MDPWFARTAQKVFYAVLYPMVSDVDMRISPGFTRMSPSFRIGLLKLLKGRHKHEHQL